MDDGGSIARLANVVINAKKQIECETGGVGDTKRKRVTDLTRRAFEKWKARKMSCETRWKGIEVIGRSYRKGREIISRFLKRSSGHIECRFSTKSGNIEFCLAQNFGVA